MKEESPIGGTRVHHGAGDRDRYTGSMGRTLLAGMDAEAKDKALAAVSEALTPYVSDGGVCLGAAVWLVTATA